MKNLMMMATEDYEALYDEACTKKVAHHTSRVDGKRNKKGFDRSVKEANRRLSLDADIMS